MNLEILVEQNEQQLLHYFCLITEHRRYDLTIGYSNQFFGKAMVTSIQTSKMVLLCQEDISTDDYWAEKLGIAEEDIPEFQEFFRNVLLTRSFQEY